MKDKEIYRYAMDRLAVGAEPERVIQELTGASIDILKVRGIVGTASRDMIVRDYYEVLGISRTASAEDIRNAFRRKALQVHPDRNTNSGAAERFKQINAIYQILSDPQKRADYDRGLHSETSNSEKGRQESEDDKPPVDPETLAKERMAAGYDFEEIIEELIRSYPGMNKFRAEKIIQNVSQSGATQEESEGDDNDTSDGKSACTCFLQLLIFGVVVAVIIIFVRSSLCNPNSSAQSLIDDMNKAAELNSVRERPFLGEARFVELLKADCFKLQTPDADLNRLDLVNVVSCDSSWDFMVTELVLIELSSDEEYPGADYFRDVASERCPQIGRNYYTSPTSASWELGHRTVKCLLKNSSQIQTSKRLVQQKETNHA